MKISRDLYLVEVGERFEIRYHFARSLLLLPLA